MSFRDLVQAALLGLEVVVTWRRDAVVIHFNKRAPAVRLLVLDENDKEITTMVILNADKKRVFTLKSVDTKERPAAIDTSSVPVWAVVPEGGLSLFPAADGMTCEVVWLSALATQDVTVEADGDTGSGVKRLSRTVAVQTMAPDAATLNVEIGDEVDA